MKLLVVAGLLCLVGSSVAASTQPRHSRGCLYIMGTCIEECEEGTHAYVIGCGRMTPEPTCDEPHPQPEPYDICDYSSCYCDEPTVRDSSTGKCVTLEQCPKKEA